MTDEMEYGIFISYKSEDRHIVYNLVKNLEMGGLRCFYDKKDLEKNLGTNREWWDVIERALKTVEYVILIVSNNLKEPAEENGNRSIVYDEIYCAEKEGKRILPVKLGDCEIPKQLIEYFKQKHCFLIELGSELKKGMVDGESELSHLDNPDCVIKSNTVESCSYEIIKYLNRHSNLLKRNLSIIEHLLPTWRHYDKFQDSCNYNDRYNNSIEPGAVWGLNRKAFWGIYYGEDKCESTYLFKHLWITEQHLNDALNKSVNIKLPFRWWFAVRNDKLLAVPKDINELNNYIYPDTIEQYNKPNSEYSVSINYENKIPGFYFELNESALDSINYLEEWYEAVCKIMATDKVAFVIKITPVKGNKAKSANISILSSLNIRLKNSTIVPEYSILLRKENVPVVKTDVITKSIIAKRESASYDGNDSPGKKQLNTWIWRLANKAESFNDNYPALFSHVVDCYDGSFQDVSEKNIIIDDKSLLMAEAYLAKEWSCAVNDIHKRKNIENIYDEYYKCMQYYYQEYVPQLTFIYSQSTCKYAGLTSLRKIHDKWKESQVNGDNSPLSLDLLLDKWVEGTDYTKDKYMCNNLVYRKGSMLPSLYLALIRKLNTMEGGDRKRDKVIDIIEEYNSIADQLLINIYKISSSKEDIKEYNILLEKYINKVGEKGLVYLLRSGLILSLKMENIEAARLYYSDIWHLFWKMEINVRVILDYLSLKDQKLRAIMGLCNAQQFEEIKKDDKLKNFIMDTRGINKY